MKTLSDGEELCAQPPHNLEIPNHPGSGTEFYTGGNYAKSW